ncbi:MAG: DUF4136 domain-containing protein [bacterium]
MKSRKTLFKTTIHGYGGWGWGGRGYYGHSTYSTSTDARQYTEGTLAVELYDVATDKPVWHAGAVRKITKKIRENPGDTVREIPGDMFAFYPP